jgi:hypothetical protein
MQTQILSVKGKLANFLKFFQGLRMTKNRRKRGPKSEHLVIEGDWEKAVKKAINRVKPKDGWPEKKKKPQ